MICKKCNCSSSVTLRRKDFYCDDCFTANTNHKFRACIGKSKLIASNASVLLCLSGRDGSTVLLDLVYNGLRLDNHKKLRVTPVFLHICDDNNIANEVIKQCRKYNFNIYIANISEYFQTSSQLPDVNCIPNKNNEAANKLDEMLKGMPPTVFCDFLKKLKRSIYIRYAELLQCQFIFTAETTTSLAISLLSNLSIGRGSQVESDVGFMDNRDENIKILRPMKDISIEELNNYIRIKQLTPVHSNDVKANSLQSVITSFVTDLQENFQSTISTVCKTADKIGVHDDTNKNRDKCIICESDLNVKGLNLSALEATSFSRMVSHATPQFEGHSKDSSAVVGSLENMQTNKSLFPFINLYLCYSCSRNYSEMNECELPQHLQSILQN